MDYITIDTTERITPEIERAILNLCNCVFTQFDPAYLKSRLTNVIDPVVTQAVADKNRLVGFKLGYRSTSTQFYSWLGGVHPDYRRRGVAQQLMDEQHSWCSANGYMAIETRTWATNTPMIILNLRAGFVIVGYETNLAGTAVVIQRKTL